MSETEWTEGVRGVLVAQVPGLTLRTWRVWPKRGPAHWEWTVRDGDRIEAAGRALGGDSAPPVALLPALQILAGVLTLHAPEEQPAPSAPEEVPCSD